MILDMAFCFCLLHLCFYLSVCLSVCLSIFYVYLLLCLTCYPCCFVCLFLYLFVCLSIFFSVSRFISISICQLVCLFDSLCVSLFVCPSILSICFSASRPPLSLHLSPPLHICPQALPLSISVYQCFPTCYCLMNSTHPSFFFLAASFSVSIYHSDHLPIPTYSSLSLFTLPLSPLSLSLSLSLSLILSLSLHIYSTSLYPFSHSRCL